MKQDKNIYLPALYGFVKFKSVIKTVFRIFIKIKKSLCLLNPNSYYYMRSDIAAF